MAWNDDNLAPPENAQQQGWQTPPPPPPPPPPPQQQLEQPREKSGCGKWVVCGCVAAFVGMIAFVGGVLWFVVSLIRNSEVYAGAIERAQRDPRVIAVLGEPIVPNKFPMGSISINNATGNADVTIPIRGSKESAKIHAIATKSGSTWTYTTLLVTTESGQTIDLLQAPPPG
ncbi:MAG TPA: cytochrome c oxidase assembly factor Coa1 family protein [Thermoanaerobaculia bacterium]|nr:cytochrome c oxidase assembly factor Coa1 family protein [Thermoanaerobaculia bacterium]